MTIYLDGLVVEGELFNLQRNTVRGWLLLTNGRVVHLQLTGNCAPDLFGQRVRFGPVDEPPEHQYEIVNWASRQIGPTGLITADHRVTLHDPESGDTREVPGFMLEWFGQNGHVVLQIPAPVLEFGEPPDDEDEDDEEDDQTGPETDDNDDEDDEDDEESNRDAAPETTGNDDTFDEPGWPTGFDADDPWNVLPESELAPESRRGPGEWEPPDDDPDDVLREMELMDHCVEGGEGLPVAAAFDGLDLPPRPEDLDDDQIQAALTTVLARLARGGVALDMCEHVTPRQAYTYLLDDVFPKPGYYPEVRGTGWIQHFATHDICPTCIKEFEDDDF